MEKCGKLGGKKKCRNLGENRLRRKNLKEDNGKQISCSPQLEEADKRWHVSAIQSNPTIILISVSSLILFHLCFVAHDLLFSLFSWQGFAIADIQSFPTMFISSLCFFLTDFCFRWQGLAISDIPRYPAIAKGTLNHKKHWNYKNTRLAPIIWSHGGGEKE